MSDTPIARTATPLPKVPGSVPDDTNLDQIEAYSIRPESKVTHCDIPHQGFSQINVPTKGPTVKELARPNQVFLNYPPFPAVDHSPSKTSYLVEVISRNIGFVNGIDTSSGSSCVLNHHAFMNTIIDTESMLMQIQEYRQNFESIIDIEQVLMFYSLIAHYVCLNADYQRHALSKEDLEFYEFLNKTFDMDTLSADAISGSLLIALSNSTANDLVYRKIGPQYPEIYNFSPTNLSWNYPFCYLIPNFVYFAQGRRFVPGRKHQNTIFCYLIPNFVYITYTNTNKEFSLSLIHI